MTNTAALVRTNYPDIIGQVKDTITDVTCTSNSETVTAAQLGLTKIEWARADIQTGVATDTGTYVNVTIIAPGTSCTVASFVAAGTAATQTTGTVIRIYARGT